MQKKLTKKQKTFHFLWFPILSFLGLYLTFYLISYLFGRELPTWEYVMTSLASAIGISIAHWIDLLYPPPRPDSKKEKKSLKQYFNEYVRGGTPFHRLMVLIYSLCILGVIITIVWITITGEL